jgi:hypothetical protein
MSADPRPVRHRDDALGNAEFLWRHAAPGRIGLCGGSDAVTMAIRRAQGFVTEDGHRSPWSHAFLFTGERIDGHHWVIESDLDLRSRHLRLGAQENRLERYFDDEAFPNLAVLDFGLDADQTRRVLCQALDLVAGASHYSLKEILGTLFALPSSSLRKRRNLLASEGALYCSAMVQHCFDAIDLRFRPSIDGKNLTPHDIARAEAPHTSWQRMREPAPGGKTRLRRYRQAGQSLLAALST